MPKVQKINQITHNYYSDEWYTNEQTVKLCISLLQPKPRSVVLCPFDGNNSIFVKELKYRGFTVLNGMTDFLHKKYYADYIMTNPPFSIKDDVIKQVYAYGIPSLLILPIDSLGGVRRHELYKQYGYPSVYVPSRRINYFDKDWKPKNAASFHSIISLFNTGQPSGIIWEK
jgi:hypothetical protein